MQTQGVLSVDPVQRARTALGGQFDPGLGGFGPAPRAIPGRELLFLLAAYGRHGDRQALHMACSTLRRLALGGINDQISGGFWQASDDRWWMLPRCRKRLEDNVRLINALTRAWQATGDEFHARIALETARWLIRELLTPAGTLLRALGDPDSVEERSQVYWQAEAVRTLLDDDEFNIVARRYGLDEPANAGDAWHLHVYATLSELAADLRTPRSDVQARLQGARLKLRAARDARFRPIADTGLDPCWNARAIEALAETGRLLDAPELIDTATSLWQVLETTIPATTLDQPDRILAGLALLRVQWDPALFEAVCRLGTDLRTGAHRIEWPDDQLASAVAALSQLGALLADTDCCDRAEQLLRGIAAQSMARQPLELLDRLDAHLHGPMQILVQGTLNDSRRWLLAARRGYDPDLGCYHLQPGIPLPPAARNQGASARPADPEHPSACGVCRSPLAGLGPECRHIQRRRGSTPRFFGSARSSGASTSPLPRGPSCSASARRTSRLGHP